MTIFSNLNLKRKLVSAFVAIALITCAVTAIAWWNLTALRGKLSDVTNTHLPSVRSLGDVRLSAETFKMVRRAMRNCSRPCGSGGPRSPRSSRWRPMSYSPTRP